MFGHRDDHQQGKGTIQGRKRSYLPGKHGDINSAEGDARDDIRDISKLVDQLGKPGAAALDDGIAEQDTQQGGEKGRIKGKLDGIPGSFVDPRVKQDTRLAIVVQRVRLVRSSSAR